MEYVERVKKLLQLDQSLCKMCGSCCRFAPFREGLSYEEILEVAEQKPKNEEEAKRIEGARDFLSIFEPWQDSNEVKAKQPKLVEAFEKIFKKDTSKGKYFFRCRFLGDDNTCKNYENRPNLCRVHPVVAKGIFTHEGCGFEKQLKQNWEEIEEILKFLESIE